jgi:hypothetical protein
MHLTDSALADTATVAFVVSFVHWLFPSFDYRYSYTSAYACDLCSICLVYRQIVLFIQLFLGELLFWSKGFTMYNDQRV